MTIQPIRTEPRFKTSPPRPVARKLKVTVAALALALGMTAFSTTTASAAVGSWSVPAPQCERTISGAYVRNLHVHAPTVFAPNLRAGSGNDQQLVRLWTRLYDAQTGTLITNYAFVGEGIANDNSPARFPVLGYFTNQPTVAKYSNIRGAGVRVQMFIAWYSMNGVHLDSVTPSLTAYRHMQWGTPNYLGTYDRC